MGYLNAQEAAEYLKITRQRVYVLAAQGRIGQRLAGYWVFTKEELDRYLETKPNASKGGRPKKQCKSPYAGVSS
jgi:excisionase family DNA binding protein